MIDNLYNNSILFPADLLDNNWPFSYELSEKLVRYNVSHHCSSLKTFLLNTALSEDSDSESDSDYVENCHLVDPSFSFKGEKVYHYSPAGNNGRSVEETIGIMYCMDNISYDNLMCEAIKFSMKHHIEESKDKDNLVNLQIITYFFVWVPISQHLLYTRFSFFVKNLIEEKKYMEKFQVELMFCSSRRLLEMIESTHHSTVFLSEKVISPKDRLLNLLSFYTLLKDKRERLVDNFFKTNSFKEIIYYYKTALSDTDYFSL